MPGSCRAHPVQLTLQAVGADHLDFVMARWHAHVLQPSLINISVNMRPSRHGLRASTAISVLAPIGRIHERRLLRNIKVLCAAPCQISTAIGTTGQPWILKAPPSAASR